jgi:hypothetical protein
VLVHYPEQATVLPIDAKYKRATPQAILSDDLHQMLTYASAYTMQAPPRAMVVHPSDAGWTHHWVSVTGPRGLLGEVLVTGVDIGRHLNDSANQLRVELDRLLARQVPLPYVAPR